MNIKEIDFGEAEAEYDSEALSFAFFKSTQYEQIHSNDRLPIVIGRKGAGKSALVTRIGIDSISNPNQYHIKLIPSDFRHAEIRELLSKLVDGDATWQYIYRKVWEGLILGQIINIIYCKNSFYIKDKFSSEFVKEADKFCNKCHYYVDALDTAISEALDRFMIETKKSDRTIVSIRRILEPYNWSSLIKILNKEFEKGILREKAIYVCLDGLDEYWDTSRPSLYFLSQSIEVVKDFSSCLSSGFKFVLCLRDNIFRALVDTKCIEYDKLESSIIHLVWSGENLFSMIASRAMRKYKNRSRTDHFKYLLPDKVNGIGIVNYLEINILNRPRDYINFFKSIQKDVDNGDILSEKIIEDAVCKYSSNRIVDLENEFGLTYPGISKIISLLQEVSVKMKKMDLLVELRGLYDSGKIKEISPEFERFYNDPEELLMILVSIGVIGFYKGDSINFIHEFSPSRVGGIIQKNLYFGLHPIYSFSIKKSPAKANVPFEPKMVSSDYLPENDDKKTLETYKDKIKKDAEILIDRIGDIESSNKGSTQFEKWVQQALELLFINNLSDGKTKETTFGDKKIFEMTGQGDPWGEIISKNECNILFVACKNIENPSEVDTNEIVRDMGSLGVKVSVMIYRSENLGPGAKLLELTRPVRLNTGEIIISVPHGFLLNCLKSLKRIDNKFNRLWKDHLGTYLKV